MLREPGPLAAAVPDDLPDRLDPMLVKELRQGMRGRWFVIPFAGVHAVAVTAVLLEFTLLSQLDGDVRWAASLVAGAGGVGLIWLVTALVIGVVVPLRGYGALQEEMRDGNVELLLGASLSRWRIVVGKWLVLCSQSWLLLVSLLPYFLVRYFAGGLDVAENMVAVLLLLGHNAAASALVIGASSYAGYGLRIVIGGGGFAALSALGTGLSVATIASMHMPGRGPLEIWFPWVLATVAAASYMLYTLYGLQLGRTRLRVRDRPYEVPPSRLLVALIFVTPLIMWLALSCFIIPALIVSAGLCVLVMRLDVSRMAAQAAGPGALRRPA